MINQKDWLIFTFIIIIELLGLVVLSQAVSSEANLLMQKKHQLLAYEQKDTSFNQMKQDYQLISKDMAIIDEALPNKVKIIDFINLIEKEASSSGIETKIIFSNQSISNEPTSGLKSLKFTLDFQSSYGGMINLIKKIEKMTQVVTVERVQIQSPKGLEGENNIILGLKCFIDANF